MTIGTIAHLMFAGALALSLQGPLSAASQTAARSGAAEKSGKAKAPLDHLKAARASLEQVAAESLTSDAAGKLADLKQRLAALEQSYVSFGTKTMSKQETPSGSTRVKTVQKGTWSSQVADLDTVLARLIDSPTAITAQPDQDESVKGKLRDVRTHFTAFAVAASGTGGAPEPKRDNR